MVPVEFFVIKFTIYFFVCQLGVIPAGELDEVKGRLHLL